MASTSPASTSGTTSPGSNGILDGSSSDLSIKYHKLATEYAKLRTQFNVVRKAVVEEQAKSADLSENLRVKEVKERKWEAEMESLNFRNQQLTKRIQFLQDDMERIEKEVSTSSSNSHHSKKKSSNKSNNVESLMQSAESLNSVMGKELQIKIEENAKLQSRLSDIDQRYEDLIRSLQFKIKELENESKQRDQSERAETSKVKDLMDGIKAENRELKQLAKQTEKDIVDLQDKITLLTVQLESASMSSPTLLRGSRSNNSFPLNANEALVQSVELLSQFGEIVTELVANLSDYHTYWEHRLKDTHPDGPLSQNASSLSKLLLQNVKHLKPIEEAYQSVMSKVLSRQEGETKTILSYFQVFASSFEKYTNFVCEAEPLTIACLQYENNLHSCTPNQMAKNSQLQSCIRALNRTWVRLGGYLNELCGDDETSSIEALENITVIVTQLNSELNELSNCYHAKSLDENQLPTTTEQLKNTNQCICAALNSLVANVSSLSRHLSDSLPRIVTLIGAGSNVFPTGDKSEVLADAPVVNDEPVSVLLDPSEKNTELEDLREQKEMMETHMNETKEKIRQLEQDREHWKLEYQLLQMKFDKRKNSGNEDNDDDDNSSLKEKEVKEIFTSRINQMVSQNLLADSKACSFFFENLSLKKRAASSEKSRLEMQSLLLSSQQQIRNLQDELGTTASNYESQIKILTEHVAHLNDKLTSQTDEIENLKYGMSKKGKK